MNLKHRLAFTVTGAAIAAAALACGSSSDSDDAAPVTPEATTRVVETMDGSVEVPIQPERIVLLNYDMTGAEAFALFDIPVLGIDSLPTTRPEIELTGELIEVGATGEIDIEMVASLNPDLITGMYRTTYDESLERLRQIAPVALLNGEAALEWREVTEGFGHILNRESDAEQLIAETEARIIELKERIDPSTEVAVVRPNNDGTFRVYADESFPGLILAELGISIPEEFSEVRSTEGTAGSRGWSTLSAERVDELDAADYVILWAYGGEPELLINQILENPLWPLLDVAREERYYVGSRSWYGAGPLSVAGALDDVEAALLAAD